MRLSLSGLVLLSAILAPAVAHAQLDPASLTDEQAEVVDMVSDAWSYLISCPSYGYDMEPDKIDQQLEPVGLHISWTPRAADDGLHNYIVEQARAKAAERGTTDDPETCEEALALYGGDGTAEPHMIITHMEPLELAPLEPAQ